MIIKVGKHKVRHGDVHDVVGISELVGQTKAGIFYSDPPWGTGNLHYWDTMNKKMNGGNTPPPSNFDVGKFLDTVLGYAVKYTDGFVAIEYGKRWTAEVIDRGQKLGLIYCSQVEEVYGGHNHPVDLIVFHTASKVDLDLTPLFHLKGYKAVREAFKLLKSYGLSNNLGMDLCCGMGYTAQACVDNGLSFVGNELNKTRLDKTITRLKKDKNNA